MSQRKTVPKTLPTGDSVDSADLSPQREAQRLLKPRCRQWLACTSVTLSMLMVGTVYGWTTTSLLHLTSGTGDVPLTITQDESSWIVSLTVLGSMVGSLVGAQLADRKGRKYCLLLCCAMFTLGWIIIYTTTFVENLYLARVILGIGVGIAYTVNPMYVSEVADINIRGAIGTLIAVNVFTGSLLTCILGLWLTFSPLVLVLVVVSFLCFLANTCFPETPYFLLSKGRKKQACKSITYYKGIVDPQEMKIELRALRPQIKCKLQPESKSDLSPQSTSNFLPEFFPQSTSDFTVTSKSYFTSQSGSGFPSISLQEAPSDSTCQVVDPEPESDLHLPSSSDSPSQSISVIHSEAICEVHPEPTGELCIQHPRDSLELPLQPPREFHFQPTSELHLASRNEAQSPSTSELPPPSKSELQPPSKSELRPPPERKLQSPSIRELPTESSINFPSPGFSSTSRDSRKSIGTNEPYVGVIKQTWLSKLKAIQQRKYRKALFIMLGLIMAQQLSGNFITTQYMEVLFSKTTVGIEPNIATILVLAVGFISGILSTLTVEYLGRRTLLILSTLGSCFTLFILATYLLLIQHKVDVSIISILPVIDLIIYQLVYQIGLGTLPNVLLCELFPMELRGFVGAITVIFDGIIGFTVSKLYQVITDYVGSFAVYFIFAIACCLAYLMVFKWVPETKGKTYQEIEALLTGKNLNSLNEEVRTGEKDIRRI